MKEEQMKPSLPSSYSDTSDTCSGVSREMYASEWINRLIESKELEIKNLVTLRDMLPANPTSQQSRAIRQLIKQSYGI